MGNAVINSGTKNELEVASSKGFSLGRDETKQAGLAGISFPPNNNPPPSAADITQVQMLSDFSTDGDEETEWRQRFKDDEQWGTDGGQHVNWEQLAWWMQ